MSDPSFDVITIHKAAKELRKLFAPMALTRERAADIQSEIKRLQQATSNINRWLDETQILQ
jgi:phage-related minor tail protein